MIKDIADLNFESSDTEEIVSSKIKEKLNIDIPAMKDCLSNFVIDNSDQLSNDFVNIIPYGDYSKFLEDADKISKFLKDEASKIENWKLIYITPSDINQDLIEFVFNNKSIDDGDIFQGHIFLNKSGKIKHAFTKVMD